MADHQGGRRQSRVTRCEWGGWARAMPIDTAVAAMTSEMASATVAISSMPAFCRFENVRSEIGDTKPTFSVSGAMVVTLRESILYDRKIASDTGAGSSGVGRSY